MRLMMKRRAWIWAASLTLGLAAAAAAGCELGGGEGDDPNGPAPFDGPVWGADCRPTAQGYVFRSLDPAGDVFLLGGGGSQAHGEVTPTVMTADGGDTFWPALVLDDPEDRSARLLAYEVRDANRAPNVGISAGGATFLSMGDAASAQGLSDNPAADWMAIRLDGEPYFEQRLAEFASYELGEGMWANRRWAAGTAVLKSDGERVFLSEDEGATFREVSPSPTTHLGDGRWSAPDGAELSFEGASPGPSGGMRVRVDRTPPGGGAVEAAAIDFGVADVARVLGVLGAPAPGVYRVLADRPAAGFETPRVLLCDVGPGVTSRLALLAPPKALDQVEPGELARVARIQHGTEARFDTRFMGLTPTLRVAMIREFAIGTNDYEPPMSLQTVADRGVEQLFSPVWMTEEAVGVLELGPNGRPQLASFSFAEARSTFVDDLSAYRTLPGVSATARLGRVTSAMGLSLVHYGDGATTELRRHAGLLADPEAEVFTGRATLSGRSVLLTQSQATQDGHFDTMMRLADAVEGRLPSVDACWSSPDTPGCVRLEGVRPSLALADRDGRLFALDSLRRRLLRHRPDLGPDAWDVLVDGLHDPTDFELLHHEGRTFALVADVDAYAVDVDSPEGVTRRMEGGPDDVATGPLTHEGHLPRLSSVPGGAVVLPDVGGHLLCLDGSSFGEGGVLRVSGREVTTTTWSDSRICAETYPRELPPGRIQVIRADGARSTNTLAVVHAPRVDAWEVPDVVTPGTSIHVWGQGLHRTPARVDSHPLLWPPVTVARQDLDHQELFFNRPGVFTLRLGDLVGPTVTVLPRILRTCQVGPRTRCRLLVQHVGTSLLPDGEVTVGGQPAEVEVVRGALLELAPFEGLAPGTHPLTVTIGGATAEGEVEILPYDVDVLVTAGPSGDFVRRRAQRPPVFDDFVLQPRHWTGIGGQGEPTAEGRGVARIPLDLDLREVTREGESGFQTGFGFGPVLHTDRSPYLLVDGERLYALGYPDPMAFESGAEPGAWETVDPGGWDGFEPGSSDRVAAARVYRAGGGEGGRLVTVFGRALTTGGELRGVRLSGATFADEATEALLEGELFRDTTVAWLGPERLYVTTCGSPQVEAGVARARVTVTASDGEVAVTVGEGEVVVGGEGGLIVACHGGDAGLTWLELGGGGLRLRSLGADDPAPVELGVLPAWDGAAGPASFAVNEGVLAMEVLDGGDVVLLVRVLDDDGVAGIRLLRWRVEAGEAVAGPVRRAQARSRPGDFCVGPWVGDEHCGDVGKRGCNLMACDQGLEVPLAGGTTRIEQGDLRVLEDHGRVHVFVEVVRNGYELQHIVEDMLP